MHLKDLDLRTLEQLSKVANRPEFLGLLQWLRESQAELDCLLRDLEGNSLLRAQGAAKLLDSLIEALSEAIPERIVSIEGEKEDEHEIQ